jgi:hypothetical protein
MRATLGRICAAGGLRRRVAGSAAGQIGQMGQVRLFGLVEVQGSGEGVEDAVGGAGEVVAFELNLVLDADPPRSATSLRRSPRTRRLRL